MSESHQRRSIFEPPRDFDSSEQFARRNFHPQLKSWNLRRRFLAFRRFHTTWLGKNRAPEDLIRFWLGHADKTVTDGYSKLGEDAAFRKLAN
jgi:integrase